MIAPLFFWFAAAAAPEMVPVPGASVSMAKTPVTNAQYLEFVKETGHPAPERNSVGSSFQLWKNGSFPGEIANQPVVNVSWKDAVAYAAWLSKKTGMLYRLPTDEEWTRAAEGRLKGKPYPWGDGIDKTKAWYGAKWNGAQTLKPADFGAPNSIGLYGMAGNVWQWTADWHVPMFNGRPVQEELEMFKTIRGGSWANEPDFLKVGYRSFHPPDFKDFFVGFRLVVGQACAICAGLQPRFPASESAVGQALACAGLQPRSASATATALNIRNHSCRSVVAHIAPRFPSRGYWRAPARHQPHSLTSPSWRDAPRFPPRLYRGAK